MSGGFRRISGGPIRMLLQARKSCLCRPLRGLIFGAKAKGSAGSKFLNANCSHVALPERCDVAFQRANHCCRPAS